MPGRGALVVLIYIVIWVAIHHLATVPGIGAVVVAPPWMEFVIAFPGVVVNFSLLPEFSDLSWSGSVSESGGHGELVGELSGVGGVELMSGVWNGEFVVLLGELL